MRIPALRLKPDEAGAGGYLFLDGQPVRLTGAPVIQERIPHLRVELPIQDGKRMVVEFAETGFRMEAPGKLELRFSWEAARTAPVQCAPHVVTYSWPELTYQVLVPEGDVTASGPAWTAIGDGRLRVQLGQI